MKTTLLKYWDRIRSGLWFIPTLMVAGSAALAFAMVAADRAISDRELVDWSWVYTGGAEGASAVLETISSSTVTLAGVVFSMTLIALTLASSQFGPLLLRNFMRDTPNQLVIGTFVGTFLYCLLVLRTIHFDSGSPFVPQLSVTIGMVLALASLVLLIYFIHHVAVSIQSERVAARVAAELTEGIDRLFPEQIGSGGPRVSVEAERPELVATFERESEPVTVTRSGYLQLVDADGLMRLAVQESMLVRIEHSPGDHLVEGMPLARVWPGGHVDDALARRVRGAFEIGDQRTPTQDIRFAIHQLVEVALRALSPGVNEPFTAITCVDRLGAALCRLAGRETPSPYRLDEARRVRVIAPVIGFTHAVDQAFDPIRRAARAEASVTLRLLDALAVIAGVVSRPEDRDVLREHAERIVRAAREALPDRDDRRMVLQRFLEVRNRLDEAGQPGAGGGAAS